MIDKVNFDKLFNRLEKLEAQKARLQKAIENLQEICPHPEFEEAGNLKRCKNCRKIFKQ